MVPARSDSARRRLRVTAALMCLSRVSSLSGLSGLSGLFGLSGLVEAR